MAEKHFFSYSCYIQLNLKLKLKIFKIKTKRSIYNIIIKNGTQSE